MTFAKDLSLMYATTLTVAHHVDHDIIRMAKDSYPLNDLIRDQLARQLAEHLVEKLMTDEMTPYGRRLEVTLTLLTRDRIRDCGSRSVLVGAP